MHITYQTDPVQRVYKHAGETRELNASTLEKMAQFLNCSPEQLLKDLDKSFDQAETENTSQGLEALLTTFAKARNKK
ncbi:hypothetical protein SR70_06645 [Klebsiella aerogenes]|uniref:helix-turn-helix domain-containing protein n=1 Tax=Klebsiella aerogenes TaxID=548 RepID=UPI0005EDC2E2|nr:helix-turn-helix domain-containing protein [Klebsiella aerogenes]KJP43146.1 hypothetical protein SR70_06645 [Klebsiella aerogenes]